MTDQFDDHCTVNGELLELQEVKAFNDHNEANAFLSKHFKSGHFTLDGIKNGKRCIAVYVPSTYDGGIEIIDLTGEVSDLEFTKRTLPFGATITSMSPASLEELKRGDIPKP